MCKDFHPFPDVLHHQFLPRPPRALLLALLSQLADGAVVLEMWQGAPAEVLAPWARAEGALCAVVLFVPASIPHFTAAGHFYTICSCPLCSCSPTRCFSSCICADDHSLYRSLPSWFVSSFFDLRLFFFFSGSLIHAHIQFWSRISPVSL